MYEMRRIVIWGVSIRRGKQSAIALADSRTVFFLLRADKIAIKPLKTSITKLHYITKYVGDSMFLIAKHSNTPN
jgi:hypothetical protein